MATLTIRKVPDELRDRLRVLAAKKGRSMEAEARAILTSAVLGSEGDDRSHGELRTLRAAARPGAARLDSADNDSLAAWNRFQSDVVASATPATGGQGAVDLLLRERRRESIVEMIKDGDDPRTRLGDRYAEQITLAGLSDADVEALQRRLAEAGR